MMPRALERTWAVSSMDMESLGALSRATELGHGSDMAEIDALSLAVYVSGGS
jgi:hypothetical protein